MRRNRGVRLGVILTVVASLLILPRPGQALFGVGDVVFDPTNLLQNTLTAIRTLQSNLNEATQIANQVQQLANDALNLATLPLSLLQDLQAQFQTYTALLRRAQGLSFQVPAWPGSSRRSTGSWGNRRAAAPRCSSRRSSGRSNSPTPVPSPCRRRASGSA